MRRVCFMPSEPVMPCTMILLFSFKKMLMLRLPAFASSAALSAASSIVSTSVTSGCVGLGQDAPALVDVVAVQPDDQRLVRLVAQHAQRGDDAVGHRVARGDAAEDVDEHRAHGRVVQDDVQPVGHDLGTGAAADVQEVGRLDAAVLLAGVGDDVQRRHDQPGAVADDADLAVELDVVEVLLLGLGLERVGGLLVLELRRCPAAGSRRCRRGSPCRRARRRCRRRAWPAG